MPGIISLQRSIEHRFLPLCGPEEPDDEEEERLALEKLDGKCLSQDPLTRRPQNEDAWARNANILVSLMGFSGHKSLTETPFTD